MLSGSTYYINKDNKQSNFSASNGQTQRLDMDEMIHANQSALLLQYSTDAEWKTGKMQLHLTVLHSWLYEL